MPRATPDLSSPEFMHSDISPVNSMIAFHQVSIRGIADELAQSPYASSTER